MRIRSKLRTRMLFGAAVMSAITAFTPMSPASAQNASWYYNVGGHAVAYGSFNGELKLAMVNDQYADSRSAVMRYKVGWSGAIHTLWDHDGAGNSGAVDTVNLPAGTTLYMKLCRGIYSSQTLDGCEDSFTTVTG